MNGHKSLKAKQFLFIIRPGKAASFLFCISVGLFTFNLIGIFIQKILGYSNYATNAFMYFFDASRESNIPTLFSTLLLFLSSILGFVIYLMTDQKTSKFKSYWLLISIVLLFLTIDEATSIHEQFNKIKNIIPLIMPGYSLYAPWILPYALFTIIVGIFLLKFALSLDAKTRKLLVLAGVVYVSGAIGFELLETQEVVAYGVAYYLLCSVEEFLEMMGTIILIYTLLNYMTFFNPSIRVAPRRHQKYFKDKEIPGRRDHPSLQKKVIRHTENV